MCFIAFMKIDFQTINLYQPNINKSPINRANFGNISYSEKYISSPYYVPFGCTQLAFDKKMESLSGIHCPSCGIKMISAEEMNEILENCKDIKNTGDFVEYAKSYKEFINPEYFFVIEDLQRNYPPEEDINSAILSAKQAKKECLENLYDIQYEYVNKLIEDEKLSESDKTLLKYFETALFQLKDNNSVKAPASEYKNILKNTIFNMQTDQKWDIARKLRNEFTKEYFENSLYNFPENAEENLYGYYVLKNILRYSNPKMVKIDEDLDEARIYNKILLCRRCEKTKKKSLYEILNSDEKHLEYYKTFISDLSEKSLNGELGEEKLYPVFMHGYMRKLSSNNLDIKGSEANALLKKPMFEINQSINFDLVDIEGIPCACCGKPTISHTRKLKLQEQIANAKDKYEILEILNNNREIIRGRYIPFVKKYEEILQENPGATDDEVLQMLRDFSKKRIKNALIIAKEYAQKELKGNRFNEPEKIRIQQYIDNVDKYYMDTDYEGIFNFGKYGQMINDTLAPIPRTKKGKLLATLRYTVKDKMAGQFALHPLQKVIDRYDSPLKVFAQNIIKESVATKDHFIARNLEGADDADNMVVLCKSCNQYKGNSPVYDWIERDKRILPNFQNYFDYIAEGIKNGEIDSSKAEYLKKLQMTAYDASKGKMDIEYNSDFVL